MNNIRLCVAYRSMSMRDRALQCGERALAIAQSGNLSDHEIQANIDIGYVYYGRDVDRGKLIHYWRRAVELFDRLNQHDSAVLSEARVIGYHRIHVLALSGANDHALTVASDQVRVCEIECDTFHLVKSLLMIPIIKLLRKDSPKDLEAVSFYAHDAIDICVGHSANQSHWVCHYVLSKIGFATGNRDSGLESLHKATGLLLDIMREPAMEIRYREFFEDIAINYRLHRAVPMHQLSESIREPSVRGHIEHIVNMTDEEFDEFMAVYSPTSTYHDGRFNLPCP